MMKSVRNRLASIHSTTAIALNDYKSTSAKSLSFLKGQRFSILKYINKDVLWAHDLASDREGYVPINYLSKKPKNLDEETWYFGDISRQETEMTLMQESIPLGSFLVRMSNKNTMGYSLSVKVLDSAKEHATKHYRIEVNNKKEFFICPDIVFNSLSDLIYYHMKYDALPCRLIQPCPRTNDDIIYENVPTACCSSNKAPDKSSEINNVCVSNQLIGYGSVYKVFHGNYSPERKPVAVKIMQKGALSEDEYKEDIQLLQFLKHENIMPMLNVVCLPRGEYIVQDFMAKGNLKDYLLSKDGQSLGLQSLIKIAMGIASGMDYLEKHRIVHRNLAARNILLDEHNVPKITKILLPNSRRILSIPVQWLAPEVIIKKMYSAKSDVWAFGVVMMEIFTYGEKPYGDLSPGEVIVKIEEGYRMPKPDSLFFKPKIYYLMLWCWTMMSRQRPNFSVLVENIQTYLN